MKQLALVFTLLGVASSVDSIERHPGGFEFQGITLNSHFTAVESRWLKQCVQSPNTRYDFCLSKSVVGDITVIVEISFLDGYVNSIHLFFPRSEYLVLLEALRLRYGHESVSTAQTARWWSHAPGGAKFPDSIQLRKIPAQEPKPDGKNYTAGVDYSEVQYSSAWVVNNPSAKQSPGQQRRIEGAAKGL